MIKKIIILLICITAIAPLNGQIIREKYEVQGGRGAETAMIVIGEPTNSPLINYYLSYNVTNQGNLWMVHLIPWTEYRVEIPYDAKVLIKTFDEKVIELSAFTKEDGENLTDCMVDNKPYNRYVSGVHCKITPAQLDQLIAEGVKKVRIQTITPNGFIEKIYNNNAVATYLSSASVLLKKELTPVDIYDGF